MSLAILSHAATRSRCNSDSANSMKDCCLKYLLLTMKTNGILSTCEKGENYTSFIVSSCLPNKIQHLTCYNSWMGRRQPSRLSSLAENSQWPHFNFNTDKLFNQVPNSNGNKTHSDWRDWRFWMTIVMGKEMLPNSRGRSSKHGHWPLWSLSWEITDFDGDCLEKRQLVSLMTRLVACFAPKRYAPIQGTPPPTTSLVSQQST
jgi:hypothetical protein